MTELTPEQATAVAGFLMPHIEMELQTTIKVLAAVPEEKKSYSPDPRSMTAGALAEHIVVADIWFLEAVANAEFGSYPQSSDKSIAELITEYQAKVPAILERIKALPAEDLVKPVKFHTWELPNYVYLQISQKHMVHHRGQLSTYLRPMGAKVPSIYGSSADDAVTAAAGENK
jgi:uncharacterized damage-inducible protein DinB